VSPAIVAAAARVRETYMVLSSSAAATAAAVMSAFAQCARDRDTPRCPSPQSVATSRLHHLLHHCDQLLPPAHHLPLPLSSAESLGRNPRIASPAQDAGLLRQGLTSELSLRGPFLLLRPHLQDLPPSLRLCRCTCTSTSTITISISPRRRPPTPAPPARFQSYPSSADFTSLPPTAPAIPPQPPTQHAFLDSPRCT
jgi:hypothetical protein